MQWFAAGRAESDPRFLLEDFEPAYLNTWRQGALEAKVEAAIAELGECRACPRDCGIDRLADQTAACRTGRRAIVSSAFAHFGEEDCLRGLRGSGTIFFSFCNLRCVFCQNWDISQRRSGREMNALEIAELMLELQAQRCHNINFVTPEHVAPQVIEAIAEAVPRGLNLPIVYNTSAYDALSSLELLDGLVDIYMPDFKFWSNENAKRLAKVTDYPERARAVIREMHRQVGPLCFGSDGVARRGVLLRHLVMPGSLDETRAILTWIADELGPDTYVNLMDQYRPAGKVSRDLYPEINRPLSGSEFLAAVRIANELGLVRLDHRHLS